MNNLTLASSPTQKRDVKVGWLWMQVNPWQNGPGLTFVLMRHIVAVHLHKRRLLMMKFPFALRLALLWHRRKTNDLLVSEWHSVFSASVRLWLVVQRQMRSVTKTLFPERSSVQKDYRESDKKTQSHNERVTRKYFQQEIDVVSKKSK